MLNFLRKGAQASIFKYLSAIKVNDFVFDIIL